MSELPRSVSTFKGVTSKSRLRGLKIQQSPSFDLPCTNTLRRLSFLHFIYRFITKNIK